MNEHLEPVFNILLPGIEEAGIDYWVYGGIGIAAYAGKFIRPNRDIDIFVKEHDFEKTRLVLRTLCVENNFYFPPLQIGEKDGRPKQEVKIKQSDKYDILSVIPAYLVGNSVEFRYGGIINKYPVKILEKVERDIDGYRFFTPPNEFIKKMYFSYMRNKENKRNIVIDAFAVILDKEFNCPPQEDC